MLTLLCCRRGDRRSGDASFSFSARERVGPDARRSLFRSSSLSFGVGRGVGVGVGGHSSEGNGTKVCSPTEVQMLKALVRGL